MPSNDSERAHDLTARLISLENPGDDAGDQANYRNCQEQYVGH